MLALTWLRAKCPKAHNWNIGISSSGCSPLADFDKRSNIKPNDQNLQKQPVNVYLCACVSVSRAPIPPTKWKTILTWNLARTHCPTQYLKTGFWKKVLRAPSFEKLPRHVALYIYLFYCLVSFYFETKKVWKRKIFAVLKNCLKNNYLAKL